MKAGSAQAESCCVYVKPENFMQHMHDIIPKLFDCWANPLAHLLLLKSSKVRVILMILFHLSLSFSFSLSPQRANCHSKSTQSGKSGSHLQSVVLQSFYVTFLEATPAIVRSEKERKRKRERDFLTTVHLFIIQAWIVFGGKFSLPIDTFWSTLT